MSLSLVTAELNGVSFSAVSSAAVTAVNNLGGGNYSVDSTEYGGSFFDFWNPAVPAGNVVSTATHSLNPLLAPGVITYQYTYGNGATPPAFGGLVLGFNAHEVLVQQIDGYVPINPAAGTYVGTLDPAHFIIFGGFGTDLSFEANAGTGPNLPITFGQTGSFGVPEPSTYALVLLALAAVTVARLPLVRRFLQSFAV
jgi:hypothetical protein